MGYPTADVDTLCGLVEHHLLLPDIATRRDLSDPATMRYVAERVGSTDMLELLAALTEADSLATGPTAWGPWKARRPHPASQTPDMPGACGRHRSQGEPNVGSCFASTRRS